MSLLSQSIALARSGAHWRTELYAVRIRLGSTTASQPAAKSPSKFSRLLNEQGSGYIQRTIATFLTSPDWATRPALGDQFIISENPRNSADVGTVWRIFELTPGRAGEEDRCVCFKLD